MHWSKRPIYKVFERKQWPTSLKIVSSLSSSSSSAVERQKKRLFTKFEKDKEPLNIIKLIEAAVFPKPEWKFAVDIIVHDDR